MERTKEDRDKRKGMEKLVVLDLDGKGRRRRRRRMKKGVSSKREKDNSRTAEGFTKPYFIQTYSLPNTHVDGPFLKTQKYLATCYI